MYERGLLSILSSFFLPITPPPGYLIQFTVRHIHYAPVYTSGLAVQVEQPISRWQNACCLYVDLFRLHLYGSYTVLQVTDVRPE